MGTTTRPTQAKTHWDKPEYKLNRTEFPRTMAWFDEALVPYWRAARDKHQLERTLDNLFEECKTLNRAELVMPTIVDWCDAETLERLRRPAAKAVRETRTPEEIRNQVVGDDAVAAIARSKLT